MSIGVLEVEVARDAKILLQPPMQSFKTGFIIVIFKVLVSCYCSSLDVI